MQQAADWQRLFEQHGPALVLLARQWCVNRADAEDAVQEVFVKVWKKRGTISDPAAYLFASVRTTALDITRRRQRAARRDLAAGSQEASAPMFQSDLEQDEWRQSIEAAMARLPSEQREVLVMKVWGELTFAQIAAALSIPANTAASRYRYAVQALRQLVSEECGS